MEKKKKKHQKNREVNFHKMHEADRPVPKDIFLHNLIKTVQN